jgi:hypothetical protein
MTVATVASLAASGYSIYNSATAGKGGGGGAMGAGFTNPAGTSVAGLFGMYPVVSDHGVVHYLPNNQYGASLFGPNAMNEISNYLNNPLPLNAAQMNPDTVSQAVLGQLGNTQNFFDQTLLPNATNLVNTGFRTSIAPITQAANYNFLNQQLPQIREQFGGGNGLFGNSDFMNSITRGLTGMDTNLGALQAQYDEAANQRRAAGLPVASELGLARQQLPMTTYNDLFNYGSLYNQALNATRPGAQLWGAYGQAAGLGTPGMLGPNVAGQSPSSGTQLLQGLSQMAPQFASGLNSLSNWYTNASNAGNAATGAGNYFSGQLNALNSGNFWGSSAPTLTGAAPSSTPVF